MASSELKPNTTLRAPDSLFDLLARGKRVDGFDDPSVAQLPRDLSGYVPPDGIDLPEDPAVIARFDRSSPLLDEGALRSDPSTPGRFGDLVNGKKKP